MKLHAQLEQTLKARINSNDEIIPALKNLMEQGKLDKPKEIAMFAIILDRLGKLEDEKLIEDSVKQESIQTIADPVTESIPTPPETPTLPATESTIQPETPPVDPTPTVSQFTPENITDVPPTEPDVTPAS